MQDKFYKIIKLLKGYPFWSIMAFVSMGISKMCEIQKEYKWALIFLGYVVLFEIFATISFIKEIIKDVRTFKLVDNELRLEIMLAKVKSGFDLTDDELKLYKKLYKKLQKKEKKKNGN